MTPEQLIAESFVILSRLQSGTENVVRLDSALLAIEAYRADAENLRAAKQMVSDQADDEGLWFIAETCAEAMLQGELRRLHAAIEGDARLTNAVKTKG